MLNPSAAADSPAEAARRYRRMADATRSLAWQAGGAELKEACLDLAMKWVILADRVRRGRRGPANDA